MEKKLVRNMATLDIANNNTDGIKNKNSNIMDNLDVNNFLSIRESNSCNHDDLSDISQISRISKINTSEYENDEEMQSLIDEIEVLERSRVRMQQSIRDIKVQHEKEIDGKESELNKAKQTSKIKIKELERELENEHNERLKLKRQNCEFEKKILSLHDAVNRASKELPKIPKLIKENSRLKILCESAKNAFERNAQEASYKVMNRKLQEQLEDAEYSRNSGIKYRQHAERELKDMQEIADEAQKERLKLESKIKQLEGEKINLSAQVDESAAELQETIRKYKNAIDQLSEHQKHIQNQSVQICNLEEKCNSLQQNVIELTNKQDGNNNSDKNLNKFNLLELKVKELDTKQEFLVAYNNRIENQNKRLKDRIAFMKEEQEQNGKRESNMQSLLRDSKRKIKLLEDNNSELELKHVKCEAKKDEYSKKLEYSDAQILILQKCLKDQTCRIKDLEESMIKGDVDNTHIADDEYDAISDDDVFMMDKSSISSIGSHQQQRISIFETNISKFHYDSREFQTKSISANLNSLKES